MGQREEFDKPYAQGGADADKAAHGDVHFGKVLSAIVTGGERAPFTGVTTDNYNPPCDEGAEAAYDRGWNGERGR